MNKSLCSKYLSLGCFPHHNCIGFFLPGNLVDSVLFKMETAVFIASAHKNSNLTTTSNALPQHGPIFSSNDTILLWCVRYGRTEFLIPKFSKPDVRFLFTNSLPPSLRNVFTCSPNCVSTSVKNCFRTLRFLGYIYCNHP